MLTLALVVMSRVRVAVFKTYGAVLSPVFALTTRVDATKVKTT